MIENGNPSQLAILREVRQGEVRQPSGYKLGFVLIDLRVLYETSVNRFQQIVY